MNFPERLYLFVIMPPGAVTKAIQEERVRFAEKYGFTKGLRPPVHISLTDIITVEVARISEFEEQISKLQQWADSQPQIPVELNDFNFFDNREKPVLYIDVIKSVPLAYMQKELTQELRRFPLVKTKAASFTPHLTIGYRDIPKVAFPDIKEDYAKRKFRGDFICDSLHLWKHEFGKWEIVRQFDLKGMQKREEQLELF